MQLDPDCDLKTEKRPAILSEFDRRAKGTCPKRNYIRNLSDSKVVYPLDSELGSIMEAVESRLKKLLVFPVERRLTIGEAIGGIPGILASVKTLTSCGYPLIYTRKNKGKRDHMWFDLDGQAQWTPEFEVMVYRKIDEMEKYKEGDTIDHYFLGYLKDDLVSPKKIREVNTRVIFANNMISIVAFRIVFGRALIAFNNSFPMSDYAIGANSSSYDMDIMHAKLQRRNRYLCGDFGNYDRTLMAPIRDAAYHLIGRLSKAPMACTLFLLKHECYSPFILGEWTGYVRDVNFSGCWVTTIINCIVNDFYQRWAFSHICPGLMYDDHVTTIILGDDHVSSFSDDVIANPIDYQKFFQNIGLTYGSAFKGEELTPEFVPFEAIMFLGCVPVLSNNKYTGALKKESIEGSLMYTSDNHLTFNQTVRSAVEQASQWGKDYYTYLCAEVNNAYRKEGIPPMRFEPWASMFRIQAGRGALVQRYSILSSLSYYPRVPAVTLPLQIGEPQVKIMTKNNIKILNDEESQTIKKTKKNISWHVGFEAQGNISSTNVSYNYENVVGDIPSQQTVSVTSKPKSGLKAKATLPMDNPPLSGGSVPMAPFFPSMSKSVGVEPTVSLQYDQSMLFREPAMECEVGDMGIESIFARRNYAGRFPWLDSDASGKVVATIPLNSVLSPSPGVKSGPGVVLLNQFVFWRADIVLDLFVPKTMFHSGKLLVTTAYGAPSLNVSELNRFINVELDFSGENMWHQVVIPYQAATEYLRTFEGTGAPDIIQDYSMGQVVISVVNELVSNGAVASGLGLHIFARYKNVHVYEMKPRPWMNMSTDLFYGPPTILSTTEESKTEIKLEAQASSSIVIKDMPSTTEGLTTLDTRLEEVTNDTEPSSTHVSRSITEPFYDFKYALESKIRRGTISWASNQAQGASITKIKVPWDIITTDGSTATIQDMAFNNYVYFTTDVELTFQVNSAPTTFGAIWIFWAPLTADTGAFDNAGAWIWGLDGVWLMPNGDTTATMKIPFKFYRNAMNTYAGQALKVETLGTLYAVVLEPLTGNTAITANITWFSSFKNSYFSIVRPRALANPEVTEARLSKERQEYLRSRIQELHAQETSNKIEIESFAEELKKIELEAQSSEPVKDDTEVNEATEQKVMSRLPEEAPERTSRRNMGRKFEFTQTSLLDVMRRHTRYDLYTLTDFGGIGWNTSVFKNTGIDSDFKTVAIPVVPLHRFAKFFKGWSGHLKYRIFVPKDGFCRVSYVPAGSYQKQPGGSPEAMTVFGDAQGGNGQSIVAPWATTNTKIVQNALFNIDNPSEVAYPTNTSQHWIDFSIPFNTHLNFLPTDLNEDFGTTSTGKKANLSNFMNGYLVIDFGTTSTAGVQDILFY
jgi:hypothetical protein